MRQPQMLFYFFGFSFLQILESALVAFIFLLFEVIVKFAFLLGLK